MTEHRKKTLNDEEVMTTTDVSIALRMSVSVSFLKDLGVQPLASIGLGTYWRKTDFPVICDAIEQHLKKLNGG